ncbi:thioesterase II family protein [Streptomyces sp. NPDC087897]|uniref:thioesterase II family protein n=1 Tax=Streptomyces sp. NPDC087897 TaxID=3365817 RepID=UPI0038101960
MNQEHGRLALRSFRTPPTGGDGPAPPGRTVYCVPAAGTGARSFLLPFARSPLRTHLRVVQLPGREDRLGEPCLDDITRMGALLAETVLSEGTDDFALYGHSFGALVALETTRALERLRAPAPALLTVAACAAPHLPQAVRFDRLAPRQIARALRNLGGLDFDGPLGEDMAAAVLPALTADCRACTRYLDALGQVSVGCPVLAQGGTRDPGVPMERITPWQDCTTSAFTAQTYPGGHFFPLESEHPLAAVLDWQPEHART